MRIAVFATVFAVFATSAWARVGETAEQAEKRYGPPTETTTDEDNIVTRKYEKGGVSIIAKFFANRSGVSVIGAISYDFGYGHYDLVPTFLDANADGQTWKQTMIEGQTTYLRQGARATVSGGSMSVTLDEYEDCMASVRAERFRKQSEQLKKEQDNF